MTVEMTASARTVILRALEREWQRWNHAHLDTSRSRRLNEIEAAMDIIRDLEVSS